VETVLPTSNRSSIHILFPAVRCTIIDGTLYLEEFQEVHLQWFTIDEIEVMEKIPMDSRCNAKVDYGMLQKNRD